MNPKIFKKFPWVALIAGILVTCTLFLPGCGREEKAGHLTLAVGGVSSELDFWEELMMEFTATTGYKVELQRHPTDTDQRRQGLVISLKAAKANPDVFLMDVAWIAQFAASGWLQTLDEYLQRDSIPLTNFFASVVEDADVYEGNLVGLPVYVDGGLLYYRNDLLERYGLPGPPVTWEQLVEYSLKVQEQERKTDPGFYGYVWQGAQYEGLICNFLEVAASKGGGFYGENGVLNVALPPNVDALGLMHDWIHVHRISPPSTFTEMKEEQARSYFQSGKALFERNWPYARALHEADDSPVKGKVGMAPLPHAPGHASAATLGGWHIGMSRYSDAKEEAFELVKFVVSYATQKKLALRLGWNPGHAEVYKDSEVLEKMPHLEALQEVFINARSRPNLPYYTRLSEVLQLHLNAALAGNTPPAQALSAAQEEITKETERYTD